MLTKEYYTTHDKYGAGYGNSRNSRNSRNPASNGLLDIADRVDRLAPCSRNPFRFHETRSELAHELREIAGRLGL